MLKGHTPAKDKINKEQFENLCNLWCTLIEISEFFGVSEDTLESWCKDTYGETFSEVYKRKNSKGKIALRRWQMKSAEKGNVTMQIWLGKQHLNQREHLLDNMEGETPHLNINVIDNSNLEKVLYEEEKNGIYKSW